MCGHDRTMCGGEEREVVKKEKKKDGFIAVAPHSWA